MSKDYHKKSFKERYPNGYKRPYKPPYFVAWDGEGINLCGKEYCVEEEQTLTEINKTETIHYHKKGCHVYALLMNSQNDIFVQYQGISTRQALDFLLEASEKAPKNAVHVIYGGSYDVNMMLKDLSYEEIKAIQAGYTVIWKHGRNKYHITYHPRKYFIVRQGKRLIKLWDVIGFFQGAFIKTVKEYLGEESYYLHKIIEGKARRGTFLANEIDNFVQIYTGYEVCALRDVMYKLAEYMHSVGIDLTSWYGSGAISKAYLKKYNIDQYITREIAQEVNDAALHAYFGGRIECMQYGVYYSNVYHYDINSAYPDAMRFLPDISSGMWLFLDSPTALDSFIREGPSFSLVHISWDFTGYELPFYPFPYRREDNAILFPRVGENWLWWVEVKDVLKRYPSCITLHEVWDYFPIPENSYDQGYKPFQFVEELYKQRQELVAQNNPAERVLKLGYNGIYGSLAQKTGYIDPEGVSFDCDYYLQGKECRIPPYHQIEYAGFITAYTRAKIWKAAMLHPKAIIAIATDGIFSTLPLSLDAVSDELEISDTKELGKWEYKMHHGITIVQSGVYWLLDKLKDPNRPELMRIGAATYKPFYRGFDPESLDREEIVYRWSVFHPGNNWYIAPSTRFMTMGAVIASKERFEKYHTVWYPLKKVLWLDMSHVAKREDLIYPDASYTTLFKTKAAELDTPAMSCKHALPWKKSEVWEKTNYELDQIEDAVAHQESWE